MRITLQLEEADRLLSELSSNEEMPQIDTDAILEQICNEYMSGNVFSEKVLSICLDGLSTVTDNSHCEVTYAKMVNLIHGLILSVYRSLQEHRVRYVADPRNKTLRLIHARGNLYVFKLE